MPVDQLPERLNISPERWREIVLACTQRVVGWEVAGMEPEP